MRYRLMLNSRLERIKMEPIGILTPRAILVRGGESSPFPVVFDVFVWVELVEVGLRSEFRLQELALAVFELCQRWLQLETP